MVRCGVAVVGGVVVGVAVAVGVGDLHGFLEADAAGAEAGELERAGEEHEAEQAGDVDCFFDEVADAQAEEVGKLARRLIDDAPDEDHHQADEHEADPAATCEDGTESQPIDGEEPERDPRGQWGPGKQQGGQRRDQTEDRLAQILQRLK